MLMNPSLVVQIRDQLRKVHRRSSLAPNGFALHYEAILAYLMTLQRAHKSHIYRDF